MEETKNIKHTLTEARLESETLELEKKQLMQNVLVRMDYLLQLIEKIFKKAKAKTKINIKTKKTKKTKTKLKS